MSIKKQRYIWSKAWLDYYAWFWDEAQVINGIRSRVAEGKRINWASVSDDGEWRLIRAATFYFGTWRAAVEAAGYDYKSVRVKPKWTREMILQAIREKLKRKQAVSSRAIQLSDPALHAAATRKKTFGSWGQAVRQAGLSYEDVCRYLHWDEERIRRGIKRLLRQGVRLNALNVLKKDQKLYWAACRLHESWGNALKALGYEPSRHLLRRPWTKEEIIEALRGMAKKGESLSDNGARDAHPTLYHAACRVFGTWVKARTAAGLSFDRRAAYRAAAAKRSRKRPAR